MTIKLQNNSDNSIVLSTNPAPQKDIVLKSPDFGFSMTADAAPYTGKGTILLVDDIPENLQLLGDILIRLGYTVRSVTSGKMALKTVRVKQPDIILLDIKMPEMDGYQVCEALKAEPELQHIPVIFISALDDVLDKVKAFSCGGIDYITKPFQVEEVVARIEGPLTIQRQQRQLHEEVKKRREAEEVLYQSRSLLASVLNSSLNGIAAMQAVRRPATGNIEDFRCLVVNPVIARALNRDREELVGKMGFKRFLHQFEIDLFEQFVAVVETGEPIAQDLCLQGQDTFWYHLTAVKLGDGFAVTLQDITDRKSIEVKLQQANQKLEELANLDGLTQIANRRCFDQRIQAEWLRLSREQQPLSLIILDIDAFKAYNDFYGHLAGDDSLRLIAQAIAQTVKRPADMVARFGGEEFVILLPATDSEGAIKVAEDVQSLIAELAIPHKQSPISEMITVSLGIATLIPDTDRNSNLLIGRADEALYQAKDGGRNRYIVASSTN
ncbi:diguanylate cyclase [Candidatus Synechococcus calcipolaris G9]|uniref:Diguanylate cyclase n=1 Tax=Candidatus Synechococcus calcipolaris G9 TaxID=1497997 RepID=A0ABT6EWH1_9SYNE|nr:diguanylate cyclase [Candidatus Synechococcus calcipolaris]MDG2989463.1 diguanylate cyclase [Candidatus Synechococcus calcipolaris G9]